MMMMMVMMMMMMMMMMIRSWVLWWHEDDDYEVALMMATLAFDDISRRYLNLWCCLPQDRNSPEPKQIPRKLKFRIPLELKLENGNLKLKI